MLRPGRAQPSPATAEGARPGSYTRSVVLASDPALVRLVAGRELSGSNIRSPAPSSRSRSPRRRLALKPFTPILAATALEDRISRDVRTTIATIERAIDPDGLVAFWPQARGNVSLTSWAYRFLIAAEKAGEPVDKKLKDRLGNVLKLALRSDYGRLLNGEEVRERVEALTALGRRRQARRGLCGRAEPPRQRDAECQRGADDRRRSRR